MCQIVRCLFAKKSFFSRTPTVNAEKGVIYYYLCRASLCPEESRSDARRERASASLRPGTARRRPLPPCATADYSAVVRHIDLARRVRALQRTQRDQRATKPIELSRLGRCLTMSSRFHSKSGSSAVEMQPSNGDMPAKNVLSFIASHCCLFGRF